MPRKCNNVDLKKCNNYDCIEIRKDHIRAMKDIKEINDKNNIKQTHKALERIRRINDQKYNIALKLINEQFKKLYNLLQCSACNETKCPPSERRRRKWGTPDEIEEELARIELKKEQLDIIKQIIDDNIEKISSILINEIDRLYDDFIKDDAKVLMCYAKLDN